MEATEEQLAELQRVYRKWLRAHMISCRSKRLYVLQEEADREAQRILLNYNRRLEARKCPICKGWHLWYKAEKKV